MFNLKKSYKLFALHSDIKTLFLFKKVKYVLDGVIFIDSVP